MRRDLDFYRRMLPPENPARCHDGAGRIPTDDRFAEPGEPSRTELGRWCDRVRRRAMSLPIDRDTGYPLGIDPAAVLLPAGWDLADDRWLTITGIRGHTGHVSSLVVDLDSPLARLALVSVAAVITQHDLHPYHRRTPTHTHDPEGIR